MFNTALTNPLNKFFLTENPFKTLFMKSSTNPPFAKPHPLVTVAIPAKLSILAQHIWTLYIYTVKFIIQNLQESFLQ